jgi:CheY-like chemotaxis protein
VAEAPGTWRERQHALRQPLNALGLYAAALQARPLPAEQQPLVRGIVESLGALEALLDQWAADMGAWEAAQGSAAAAKTAEQDVSARPDSEQGPAAAPTAPQPVPPGTDASIIVIDDDSASRMSMALLLEAWGARVVEFDGMADLGAALAADQGPPPRLVIVDYHLGAGGDTGAQALQRLQAAWPGQRIPALLISGDEAAARAVAGLEGPLQVLRKPVEPNRLLQAVENLVGRAH